ncbi:MAG: response regulator, partial [bacterium]|nr:response regulator [bacterium]
PASEAAPVAPACSGTREPRWEDGHVRVVDDEFPVRKFMRTGLSRLGYRVSCVSNGAAAVKYFARHHGDVDLVILDLTMPKMDGRDCYYAMQRVDSRVPVVVATGNAIEGAAQELLDAGARLVLKKPFRLDHLGETVWTAIRQPQETS